MPRLTCCVSTCKGAPKDPSTLLIPFPKDPILTEQWRIVSGLPPDFTIKPFTRICSKHFRSGKRSLNPDSEDYIPSVFEAPPQVTKKSYCRTCRKVTLNCPCKAAEEVDEEESEDENGEIEGEDEDEDEEENGQNDDDEEVEAPEEEPEEELDDGQVMDSEDSDWTPAVETAKPRRSARSRRKRRNPSSESSADEDSDAPPSKVVKKILNTPKNKVSPVKKVTTSPEKTPATPGQENKEAEGNVPEEKVDTTPAAKVTPKPRRRPTKKDSVTPGTGVNGTGTPAGVAGVDAADTTATSTPSTPNNRTNSKKITGVPIPTTPSPHDAKLVEKIKEMEIEHAMKLEKILKNNNLRFANLKEENLQAVHRMKVEWELEKANLQSQIEYYKEILHSRTLDEEPMNPFNGGQPIIVLPAPDHDEGIEPNNGVIDMEEEQ